jgi:hypothetical protein
LKKWYYNSWFLAAMFIVGSIGSLVLLGLPILIAAIVFTAMKTGYEKKITSEDFKIYQDYIEKNKTLADLESKISNKDAFYYEFLEKTKSEAISQANIIAEQRKSELNEVIRSKEQSIKELDEKINDKEAIFEKFFQEAKEDADKNIKEIIDNQYKLNEELKIASETLDKTNSTLASQEKKLEKIKTLYRAAENALRNYTNLNLKETDLLIPKNIDNELSELSPTVNLKLHCMDLKELRKAFKANDKLIEDTLKNYSSRYNTKANAAIYKLMVMALRAELQNVLYNLKFEKLESANDSIKNMTTKYLKLASDGNQNIAPTLVKFIGEIESLFLNATNIEYDYYVKKEAARLEQVAIREQMRQEAAERKELEKQRAQVEAEESKYLSEIEKVKDQMIGADENLLDSLNEKIKSLQEQLDRVEEKKEDIINLQNGKAGSVYVISNLGSFGDNVYKVGMTRRLDPLDRIKELGSASVPFQFDVHSMIFSNDAVNLESQLHSILDEKRVNKVNKRKEFFYSSIDELESIVTQIDPTAEFNRTLLAEEYRQSQSLAYIN